jgi:hypothetical protein
VSRSRIRLRDDQVALSRAPQTVALPGRWELPNKWPMCARLFAQIDAARNWDRHASGLSGRNRPDVWGRAADGSA